MGILIKNLKEIEKSAAMNIQFYISKGNYIYGRTAHKEDLINRLRNNGIVIRNFNDYTFRFINAIYIVNKSKMRCLYSDFS